MLQGGYFIPIMQSAKRLLPQEWIHYYFNFLKLGGADTLAGHYFRSWSLESISFLRKWRGVIL